VRTAVTDFVQWNAFFAGNALGTAAPLREQRPLLHLVAVAGIGVIGYYSGLPIADYLGLVDPAVAKSAPEHPGDYLLVPGHQRSNADYVFARRPSHRGRVLRAGVPRYPAPPRPRARLRVAGEPCRGVPAARGGVLMNARPA
jgi:hypothetical protein